MEIIHKLFKMNREQIQKICDQMECKHGSKSDMIHDLLKPLNPEKNHKLNMINNELILTAFTRFNSSHKLVNLHITLYNPNK